jgi:hypothetical protein
MGKVSRCDRVGDPLDWEVELIRFMRECPGDDVKQWNDDDHREWQEYQPQ